MSFADLVEAPAGSKHILQGNAAFALGVIHAGYHAADGYPGTPSTEVIDRNLALVQDRIEVGWSVNEAVAVGVAVGHAVAGFDAVVTMKIPGVFQAGDAISTSAFYTAEAGALVIYAATDYVPSSTQHVIDARYFFSSCRLPVLEPRNHQEMYEVAWTAADLSRRHRTPVVVLASGILAHSEGLIVLREARRIEPRDLPEDLKRWMVLPGVARDNYNAATRERIPGIRAWAETSDLVTEIKGEDDFGVIANGEAAMITREAMLAVGRKPSFLTLGVSYPLPMEKITAFIDSVEGPVFVVEDGGAFMEERIKIHRPGVIGKGEDSVITNWEPGAVLEFLGAHLPLETAPAHEGARAEAVARPPAICPGCPYRAFGLAVAKLKKKGRIYASFGDIGCSSLLYFMNALDTVLCMGGSDPMRQGFVLSRPEMAARTISIIGDSCECHSGLDGTRNAVFRRTAGVKVLLDNRVTAMTGGQPAPSSETNLAGEANRFNLREAVEAEKARTVVVDSYDLKLVEETLEEALTLAEKGEFSVLILEGPCIQEVRPESKVRTLEFNRDKCRQCGLCGICPGIEHDEEKRPEFTILCSNCGSRSQVCMQRCPFGAIEARGADAAGPRAVRKSDDVEVESPEPVVEADLPPALRLAIRGIGGQGNLFFGRVLSQVALHTPYSSAGIVKGDTHGMAQLGGAVISTFACGEVHSPVFAPATADVLVAMEMGEVLRPGFLELLKPGGRIILNRFKARPAAAGDLEYTDEGKIRESLSPYRVTEVDAYALASSLGDRTGRSANVVVLGMVSALEVMSAIPESVWLAALRAVSPSDEIFAINRAAFAAGRDYSSSAD